MYRCRPPAQHGRKACASTVRGLFWRSQWALTGPKPRCVGLGTSTGRGPAFKKCFGGAATLARRSDATARQKRLPDRALSGVEPHLSRTLFRAPRRLPGTPLSVRSPKASRASARSCERPAVRSDRRPSTLEVGRFERKLRISASESLGNDPSAGSPTDTLLRLLLPLLRSICASSRHAESRPEGRPTGPIRRAH